MSEEERFQVVGRANAKTLVPSCCAIEAQCRAWCGWYCVARAVVEVKSEGENTAFQPQWDRSLWHRWSGEGHGVTETKPEFDCVAILAGEVTF